MKRKKIALFALLVLPLAYAVYVLVMQEVNDPIKYIYTFSGITAIILLYATTTLSMFKLTTYRRMMGLFAFFYALLHLSNFLILDSELDLAFALSETLDKPFIYLGMSAFVLLLFMAITSRRKLFATFYMYHKVIYVAIVLASVHFVMAQKALSMWQWGLVAIMGLIGVLKIWQKLVLRTRV